MKKTKRVLCLLLLFCGVLTYVEWNANAKSVYRINRNASYENRLKELRKKVKKFYPDAIKYNQISAKYLEKSKDESVFTIRFSNIIYGTRNLDKIIKVPVFRGTMGDVLYDDFLEYCENKGLLKGHTEAAFKVEFKKGEFNNVLKEFKEFYSSKLSIDFTAEPAKWYYESEREVVDVYVFTLDGVNNTLSFYYPLKKYKSDATKLEYVIRIEDIVESPY